MITLFTRLGIAFMRLLSRLPLAWVRALGVLLGWILYAVAVPRRRVVAVNLALCFPHMPARERAQWVPQVFIYFAKAWLDRSWLWHAPQAVVAKRLAIKGNLAALESQQPTVIFAPHFVGLDAGWTALTLHLEKPLSTIYTNQANAQVDAWILAGRKRFGRSCLFGRVDGVKDIVAQLRGGAALYLLPDMNFGPQESLFVPFYGVPTATVPSLSRFARLSRAQVMPVVTCMTASGYEVQVLPAWADFPTDDLEADTALMNERLQGYIDTMPLQYYWVHKRFKSRPAGRPSVY